MNSSFMLIGVGYCSSSASIMRNLVDLSCLDHLKNE